MFSSILFLFSLHSVVVFVGFFSSSLLLWGLVSCGVSIVVGLGLGSAGGFGCGFLFSGGDSVTP